MACKSVRSVDARARIAAGVRDILDLARLFLGPFADFGGDAFEVDLRLAAADWKAVRFAVGGVSIRRRAGGAVEGACRVDVEKEGVAFSRDDVLVERLDLASGADGVRVDFRALALPLTTGVLALGVVITTSTRSIGGRVTLGVGTGDCEASKGDRS
jgi:hypothetical protein